MDLNECYRVLELEIGVPREAVDAACRRLLERWHPDRAAAGGPDAVREAQRMVQAINEAHRTLLEAAPDSARPLFPPPAGATPAAVPKPTLRPLAAGQPPSLPPAAGKGAARPAPVTGGPLPPPPAASAPVPAAPPGLTAPAPAAPLSSPAPVPAPRGKAGFYESLLPAGSPQRRFAPVILAAVVVLVLFLGKSLFTSSDGKAAIPAGPDPQTTGGLLVKVNRADAAVEVARRPVAGEATSAGVSGPAGRALAGLPPGRYALTVRSAGWPDIRQDVDVEAGRTAEISVAFKGGSLRLDSVPTGAAVRVGEETVGKTPLVIPDLPPGECRITLEYPSWPVLTFKTAITAGQEAAASVRLPHGKLTVESRPAGATVSLGGRAYGQTPLLFERIPAGTKKLTLEAKDFPPLEVSVAVDDGADVKIYPSLGSAFPVLDPEELLRTVWVPDNPDKLAPPNDGISGPAAPRNDIVRNLNRKRLYDGWMRKRFCLTAVVKSFDKDSGQIEFAEQKSELARYRILAKLGPEAFKDKELGASLAKGATFACYGQLTAVEEPRWPFKVITFELSAVEPLR